MAETTFKRIGSSEIPMYGPRKILICGYAPRQHEPLLAFLRDKGFGDFPVVFVPAQEEDKQVKEFLDKPHKDGYQTGSGARKAIIISGFKETELRRLLSAFREEGIPRPLLAALTPTSETWSVTRLLNELTLEAEVMNRQRQKVNDRPTQSPRKE